LPAIALELAAYLCLQPPTYLESTHAAGLKIIGICISALTGGWRRNAPFAHGNALRDDPNPTSVTHIGELVLIRLYPAPEVTVAVVVGFARTERWT
jgi:hypothetical protein